MQIFHSAETLTSKLAFLLQGYEIIDIFPSVHGCSVNGVLVRNNDLNITEYKENHIIYVKNKSVQKVQVNF